MTKFSVKELDQDTIVAISTSVGEGGIGVVRLSGPMAVDIADVIFEARSGKKVREQKTFTAQYGFVRQPDGAFVDEVVLLLMRAPKSYTCEDVVEISAHGGAALLKAIVDLAIQHGARAAAKGEFTKRAFLNGRIDLLQAEAVLSLVKAKTELSREWASRELEGEFSKEVKILRQTLLDVLSHLEASIDFPDDFPDTKPVAELGRRLESAKNSLKKLAERAALSFVAKTGFKAALVGRPNAGKSSVLNKLSGENRVIVTPIAGTTRDVVELEVSVGGFLLRLLDTAGIQESSHPIEKEGIERSKKAAAEADLILYILDGSEEFKDEDKALLKGLPRDKKFIVVLNKQDLPGKTSKADVEKLKLSAAIVPGSCIKADGLKLLEDEIKRFIMGGQLQVSAETSGASSRQKNLLEKAYSSVDLASQSCQQNQSPEIIAVDVRAGLDALGSLVGEVLTDDLLDVIFNQFCIGK